MPVYTISSTSGDAMSLTLGDTPLTIGRHPDNVLALNDALLSRFHAVIERDGNGGFRLRDLGSRNGSKVNGQKVKDAPITQGDILKIGTQTFIVETEDTLRERQQIAREMAEQTLPGWMSDLRQLIEMLPPRGEPPESVVLIDGRGSVTRALDGESEGPTAMRLLLQGASKARATDIHMEPKGDAVNVRMRVDGQMVTITDIPNRVGQLVYGVVKTACQFQPSAREVVLDGHFSTKFAARRVDYRVSFTPSVHGQKLVLRVLDQRDAPQSLRDVGLPAYMEKRVRGVIGQDAGMLLCCGPTGSGKTTTLYNGLREIDREVKNVVTIEDPVEYHIEGVTQIPVDMGKNNTFGSLLRSVLRQDPDVILVGEIRDEETARTAMQAAMTGHLVFSTVHAKDTIASIFRLLDLGVEPYLVANSMELTLAQRLVRLLCENCKRPMKVTPGQATRMGRFLEGKSTIYTATGCAQCLRTGYFGRKAIFELLDFTDELRDVILAEPSITAMKRVIEGGLFTTLAQSGWQLVARGETTLDEVDRVATVR